MELLLWSLFLRDKIGQLIPRESDIQSAICDYLAYRKVFFWRQNTAPTISKSKDGWAFRKMPKHSRRGVPDIIVILSTGQFVGLEVKAPKGRLSPEQELFGQECTKNKAQYHVVRSLDDVQALGI